MQSGRKRCTRRTAAPAGAGIAPGSGADELRGCTSPLCVRTQNPKPWYELPMSGDQISPPRRRPASADSAGLCGSTAARNKNAGQAGETAYALHRAHRKHKNTERHPRAQGTDADSAAHPLRNGHRRVNSPSARTHPKSKTRFALTNDIYSSAAPNGGAAREALTSVLSKIGSPLPLPEQPKPKAPAREGSQPHRRVLLCVRHTEKDAQKGVPYGEILWQACHSPASLGFPLSVPAACG